jgi:hypothetical protein
MPDATQRREDGLNVNAMTEVAGIVCRVHSCRDSRNKEGRHEAGLLSVERWSAV